MAESEISLEALYNPKVEQIKYFEHRSGRTALPIEMYFVEDFEVTSPPKDAKN